MFKQLFTWPPRAWIYGFVLGFLIVVTPQFMFYIPENLPWIILFPLQIVTLAGIVTTVLFMKMTEAIPIADALKALFFIFFFPIILAVVSHYIGKNFHSGLPKNKKLGIGLLIVAILLLLAPITFFAIAGIMFALYGGVTPM